MQPSSFAPLSSAGLQGRQRRHAVLHHQHELARLRAVRERSHVRAHRHRHARRELLAEFRACKSSIAVRSPLGAPSRVIAKYSKMVKVGTAKICFLAHQPHGLVAELKRMINRCHARLRRVQRARFAGGMHGHKRLPSARLPPPPRQFGFAVLIRRGRTGRRASGRPGLVNLDEVRAFLECCSRITVTSSAALLAYVGVGQHMLRRIVADSVFVPAQNIDGIAADAQPWAGNQPMINGVANRGIGRARALGAHVALGGKSGHQVGVWPPAPPESYAAARIPPPSADLPRPDAETGARARRSGRAAECGRRGRQSCASGGCVTAVPTALMRSPSPELRRASILPVST
jgi:hypothetical protein